MRAASVRNATFFEFQNSQGQIAWAISYRATLLA